jgi:hypothetical protein
MGFDAAEKKEPAIDVKRAPEAGMLLKRIHYAVQKSYNGAECRGRGR